MLWTIRLRKCKLEVIGEKVFRRINGGVTYEFAIRKKNEQYESLRD